MMLTHNDVVECHQREGHFEVDTSDLALVDGEWPQSIPTDLGNKTPFQRMSFMRDKSKDVIYVTYQQRDTLNVLKVVNS